MKRTGIATSPLHGGHCPPWLFDQMTRLSAAIVEAIILEFGTEEVLRRFSDPVWFQALGSVLGFDWHSSGLTTVVLGALKTGFHQRSAEYGLFIAGGKGKASRKTPEEIQQAGEQFALQQHVGGLERASRLSAKTDSALVQDGYQLYHHVMLFDKTGHWAVVQQGLNGDSRTSRRYHWLGETVKSFVESPHQGLVGQPEPEVLDLTGQANRTVHATSVELARHPEEALLALRHLNEQQGRRELTLPAHHHIPQAARLNKILYGIYDASPEDYQSLVALPGVGASTMRALAMVSEVVYGTAIVYHDPVRYTFAHGGKDGTPFPVQRPDYVSSLATLERAIDRARLSQSDALHAMRRLAKWEAEPAIQPQTDTAPSVI